VSPARECPNCGDPLPLDGQCDCAGDEERDCRSAYRELQHHACMVRLGCRARGVNSGGGNGEESNVVEMWV
jgi:hypothetical protein